MIQKTEKGIHSDILNKTAAINIVNDMIEDLPT